MSVQIILLDKAGNEDPSWDYTVNGGARDIFRMMGDELPVNYLDDGDRAIFRPTDFDVWRKIVGGDEFCNSERYLSP